MPDQECPNCHATVARELKPPSDFAHVNYYRCERCGHVWTTTKDGARIVHHVTPLDPTPNDATG
jgi:hypothetical protein